MKKLGLLFLLIFFASFNSYALRIYGLYMAEANVRDDGNRYYQDTMFSTYPPSAAFNGCVDVLVLKGWYCFGNNWEYEPVDNNVIDKGQKAQYENMGKCGGVTIKRLDPNVYNMLNGMTGQTAEAGTPEGYIGAANMRRVLLFNNAVLEEGTNYFTIVCPQANELMYSAMVGLYLSEKDTWSTGVIPPEGTEPDLCAKEAGAGTQDMEGEYVCGAPNPRKDVSYFNQANIKMEHPTLSCVKGDYRISIPFFYMAGTNGEEVNPDGLTSPPSPSWVAEGNLDPNWALAHTSGNEVAYLAIVVAKESTEPAISTPSVVIPPLSSDGYVLLENLGAGSFSYTASTTSSWLTLNADTATGSVSMQQKVLFTVDRNGLAPGRYVSYIDFDLGDFGTMTVKVTMIVENPKTGAVRLKGLYIMSNDGEKPYYQDTMIKSLTPAYNFDGGCMDILLANGIYLFGNESDFELCPYYDYLVANALDLGRPAAYSEAGSFQGTNTVYFLQPERYDLVNQAVDNGDYPNASSISEYVKLAGLTKKELDCYLQVGTNRFTLILPEASEFESEEMQLGLFLGEKVANGSKPNLAANDSEIEFDADGKLYATFTSEDRTYKYPLNEEDIFKSSTLKCDVGDYHLELTKFFIAGVNNEFMNPCGMTSPATPGFVANGGDTTTAWPVHASPKTALGYFEVVVTGTPEPAGVILALAALALAFLRRK